MPSAAMLARLAEIFRFLDEPHLCEDLQALSIEEFCVSDIASLLRNHQVGHLPPVAVAPFAAVGQVP